MIQSPGDDFTERLRHSLRLPGTAPPRRNGAAGGRRSGWSEVRSSPEAGTTEWGPIPGHTAPCAFDSLPIPDAATGAIREHLASRGFEVPPPPS